MQTSKLRLNADLRKKIGGLIQSHFDYIQTITEDTTLDMLEEVK